MDSMTEKILIYGAKIPAIKNLGGFRGLRVYGSRTSNHYKWELVLDVPFEFRRGEMIVPHFELEPTRPGGWVAYGFAHKVRLGVSFEFTPQICVRLTASGPACNPFRTSPPRPHTFR